MTMWVPVLTAAACAYALKLLGYVVPGRWIGGERTSRVTSALPVALLAALVAVQTWASPTGAIVLDARAAALGVAMVALLLRAPFVVVVALAAAAAAGLRWAGLA
jgi:hypothetical protein